MISHIHVLKESLLFLEIDLLDVALDFLLHLFALICIAWSVYDGVTHLDDLEIETVLPLTSEGLQFLFLIERGSEKLLTPERSVHVLGC